MPARLFVGDADGEVHDPGDRLIADDVIYDRWSDRREPVLCQFGEEAVDGFQR